MAARETGTRGQMRYGGSRPPTAHRIAVHDDDDLDPTTEPAPERVIGQARRAAVFEEVMRTASTFMAVVFSTSVLASLPIFPQWVFPAALAGVILSLPSAVSVRWRLLDPRETRSVSDLWSSALATTAVAAVVFALLTVVGRTADLGTSLSRFAAVLAVTALVAYVRGWRPRGERAPEPADVDDRDHGF